MGNCCSSCASFRAVFKPNEGGLPLSPLSPGRGSCKKPECLPKPPSSPPPTTTSAPTITTSTVVGASLKTPCLSAPPSTSQIKTS
uniref:Uncharacterized protein n=1 Tax=Timema monikensis TaxID=170555 RepID=A0A7R9E178_9NEOP|nr:unnamed protein product [Timema monikensis]